MEIDRQKGHKETQTHGETLATQQPTIGLA